MKVELRPIDTIKQYHANPRNIPQTAIDRVAESISRYGWRQPIVVDKQGVIIVGHTRLRAAHQLGMTEVPVHVADMTEEEARAYRISDNRSGEYSSWSDEPLIAELAALSETVNNDLATLSTMTAFKPDELAALLAAGQEEHTDPDDTPDPPAEEDVETQPGDIWVLGRHRLMCGDATNQEDVTRLLDGEKPNLMVTDPPWGVSYDAEWRENFRPTREGAYGRVMNDDRADWSEAWRLFPGEVAYTWVASAKYLDAMTSLMAASLEIRNHIIWVKNILVISRGHYHYRHEPLIYAVRKDATASWAGDRKQQSVWEIPKPYKSETGHSTQKPVECMERPIRNHAGDVYDPFMGSGTTIIAAERQGRRCFGMEINPAYCELAARRWANFTGNEAVRLPAEQSEEHTDES